MALRSVRFRCCGQLHKVTISTRGAVHLHNHTASQIRTAINSVALGNEPGRCIELLLALRRLYKYQDNHVREEFLHKTAPELEHTTADATAMFRIRRQLIRRSARAQTTTGGWPKYYPTFVTEVLDQIRRLCPNSSVMSKLSSETPNSQSRRRRIMCLLMTFGLCVESRSNSDLTFYLTWTEGDWVYDSSINATRKSWSDKLSDTDKKKRLLSAMVYDISQFCLSIQRRHQQNVESRNELLHRQGLLRRYGITNTSSSYSVCVKRSNLLEIVTTRQGLQISITKVTPEQGYWIYQKLQPKLSTMLEALSKRLERAVTKASKEPQK